jgi:UDP-4-amino-4-deoxy-L-arabinose formyltransferase/UDP-glucuronic acid dehydrogenase (UDP-4-keto-hexauronic acid decarboxylating)
VTPPVRVVLLAYHEMGCAGLESLRRAGAEIVAVFTHRDDPDEKQWFGSVAELAEGHRIPVFAPDRINDGEWVDRIRWLRPEMIFSFYYRRIVSAEILAIPPRGCYNLHGSLLPRFRGRSPTNWAIIEGECRTGVTLHEMEVTPDTGPIVAQREVSIGDDDDARTVLLAQVEEMRTMMAEVYPRLVDGTAPRIPQDERLATSYGGRRPEDGRIRWSEPARRVHDLVRAVTDPWPGAFSWLRGRKCMIWKTRLYAGGGVASGAPPGALLGTTPDGVLVGCGGEPLEVRRAQITPGPCIEGAELERLLGPVPGAGFGEEVA